MLDREIVFGLIAAVIGTLLVSSFYFTEPAARAPDAEPSIYSPDDIRYPLHMAEQKDRAKNKNRKAAPPPPAPETYYDEGSDDATGDSDIEQPPAEEPEIE